MRIGVSHGFTLVEAIVAIAIATGGVLALVALARQVTDSVASSRRHLVAAVYADAFISTRLDGVVPTAPDCLQRDVPGCVEALDADGRPAAARPVFIRRWRVTAVAGAPTPVWSVMACVVPIAARFAVGPAPGACVARLAHQVTP